MFSLAISNTLQWPIFSFFICNTPWIKIIVLHHFMILLQKTLIDVSFAKKNKNLKIKKL